MKAEFIFQPGEVIKSKKNGLIAPITHCAVDATGDNVYFQRGNFTEQWVNEGDAEKSELPKSERQMESKKPRRR